MSIRAQRQLSGIRVRTRRVRVSDMGVGETIKFDIFFDYHCPFVFRASRLVEAVRQTGERNLDVTWRSFSLTQVNSKDDGWTVWGAPPSEPMRGRLAFMAAEAARRQGRFDEIHRLLLAARHHDRADIDDAAVVETAAAAAGLDLDRFGADLADPSILDALARDHTEGVSRFGVFGTPTFVFSDDASAYVRLAESATENGVVGVF